MDKLGGGRCWVSRNDVKPPSFPTAVSSSTICPEESEAWESLLSPLAMLGAPGKLLVSHIALTQQEMIAQDPDLVISPGHLPCFHSSSNSS